MLAGACAHDHVEALEQREQRRQLLDRVRAVGVGDRDEVVGSRGDSGLQRASIARRLGVRADPRARVRGDAARGVARAVVDDDDLERPPEAGLEVAERRERHGEAALLVAGGNHHRQARHARARGVADGQMCASKAARSTLVPCRASVDHGVQRSRRQTWAGRR